MKDIDSFRGCLIGGAAGDALGYAVEFMREDRIFSRYGKRGITEYELRDGAAEISDDTQMTLFTAAGLLAGKAAGSTESAGGYAGHIHRAYLDWYRTQTEEYPLKGGEKYTRLADVPGLFHRRAPGSTCMSALGSGKAGSPEEPINNSKGCGGVMRAAPAGLFFCGDPDADAETVARIGAEAAALTHGHPLGWMPAAALAQIVREICRDDAGVREAVERSIETVKKMWPETRHREYLISLLNRALELAGMRVTDLEAVHGLGEGWVGEEALAVAVFCAARYEDDFDSALIAAVNHNGDSDSTGAVAGNILGARLGLKGIPAKYTERLELKDVILGVADELYESARADRAR